MEEHKPQPIPEESLELGHEVRDVNIRLIVWLSAGLLILVVVVFVVIGLLYNFLSFQSVSQSPPPPPMLQEAQGLPPGVLLQRDPAQDMQRMHVEQDTLLNNYGWVDKQAGVVHIPIERAIELTLERGLPTRPLPAEGE